jgi:hypothetical protein
MVKKANYSLQANGGKLFSSEAKCQPPTVTQLQRFSFGHLEFQGILLKNSFRATAQCFLQNAEKH